MHIFTRNFFSFGEKVWVGIQYMEENISGAFGAGKTTFKAIILVCLGVLVTDIAKIVLFLIIFNYSHAKNRMIFPQSILRPLFKHPGTLQSFLIAPSISTKKWILWNDVTRNSSFVCWKFLAAEVGSIFFAGTWKLFSLNFENFQLEFGRFLACTYNTVIS